ncbi:MAG: hypothetical protein QOG26_774 [Solirubrobacterales bacterium]|nr:hypothetical protein [Solirubrobacterales bacterium]
MKAIDIGNVLRSVLTIAAVAVALAAGSPTQAAGADTGSTPLWAPARSTKPESFWTGARMREAMPIAVIRGSAASRPPAPLVQPTGASVASRGGTASAATNGVDTGDPTVRPNRVNGRVFVTIGNAVGACSGSVVATPSASWVLTAGHCVYDANAKAFVTDVRFVPGYRNGRAPFGVWKAHSLAAAPGWIDSVNAGSPDSAVDVGAIRLDRDASRRHVEEVVGSFGIGFDQARSQTYTEYGYPVEPSPYDGSKLYSESTPYAGDDLLFNPPTLRFTSDFGAGASGGPFVNPSRVVLSVAGYTYVGDTTHIYGAYFGSAVESLYCTTAGLAVDRVRYRANGGATLTVRTPCPGSLTMSGRSVRQRDRTVSGFNRPFALAVSAIGAARQRLRRLGHARVGIRLDHTPVVGGETGKRLSLQLRKF